MTEKKYRNSQLFKGFIFHWFQSPFKECPILNISLLIRNLTKYGQGQLKNRKKKMTTILSVM